MSELDAADAKRVAGDLGALDVRARFGSLDALGDMPSPLRDLSIPRNMQAGRWLTGSALGCLAVGTILSGALHAGMDRASKPARILASLSNATGEARRGDRPVTIALPAPIRDRVIRVATVTRKGDTRVIAKKPFGYAAAPLAVAAPQSSYARFDPLTIFSTSQDDRIDPTLATIYDAEVESEVTLQRLPFDPNSNFHGGGSGDRTALQAVRQARANLDGADKAFAALGSTEAKSTKASLVSAVAAIEGLANVGLANDPLSRPTSTIALGYAAADDEIDFDGALDPLARAMRRATDETVAPSGSELATPDGLATATLTAALTLAAENVTRIEKSISDAWAAPVSREVVLTLKTEEKLIAQLAGGLRAYGASRPLARAVAETVGTKLGASADSGGELVVRLAWRAPSDDASATERDVRRVSVSQAGEHLATLVRKESGEIVSAPRPESLGLEDGNASEREQRRIALSRSMPSIYDGLMRAALSQGMTAKHAKRLVRIMAFDVDFRAKASPDDKLELFYSLAEGSETPTDESQILYASATIGGTTRRYYRYDRRRADGSTITDFYDETGRSAKKFLLRQPVPSGRFTSGYGMRRHPISRYRRMHTGVDWAAKSGSPILSAGHGTVIKRGWAGGYGRQIKIRHANGYVTSYSHLRRFARGLKVGSKVRQGQRIGQVGSSGASTGPHLHYEVLVNKRRVNPMRIRLPKGDTLKGKALMAFQRERERIDALVLKGRGNVEVASR